MFSFRKVKPMEDGNENKTQIKKDQANYENKVKELRKACQNFGEYLEEEVNEGTDFSDIIEKFKDEKKGFGKQMKKSWVLSRTSRRLNEMKKNLSKFKNKTFDPQRIRDYVACFKFEREKTKKGNIKRSAIDDEKVFKFFNSTSSTDKDSIYRVLNIKRTKAQKNKELKKDAKTFFDQADKSLVASEKALPKAMDAQTEIAKTLKNIENDQNIDQIAKMNIRNALNKQNGNLQQCIEALQQATNYLEEQQNKTKKVMDDKDYEIYGGKVISLNALYEAIDDNNAAISDLNDTIDDAEEIYSNVENYIEENKKKAQKDKELLDENAKDAYDQVDKSLTASKQAIDKATGVKDKITQTISNIKNDKGMEEDIDTLNKQNGELQECIKTLESAMKSLKEQQNQTKTDVNNKNLIDIFKWDSLNLLRSAIKDNDSATGKLNSTVNESEEVQAEVKEYIKGANARPFDSKMETFTIRTEKDFGKVKYFKDKIKNVVVEKGITTIKEKAFYFCESLASINLGNVKIIGAQAFEGCTALKSINLKNVTTIRVQAFCGTALESIDLKNVTTIEKSAFADTALKSVNLGKFQAIEDEAFSFCKALTSVELGNVQTIGVQAFYGCTALESINFKNVTTINEQAFFGCTSLKSVNFGKVKTIKESAFESCESLGESGVIDFKNVTTIGESAFFKCTALKSINLGSIQNIEGWTFQGCTGITTVTLPTDEKVAREIKRIICMDIDKTAGDGNNNTIKFFNDPDQVVEKPAAATQET